MVNQNGGRTSCQNRPMRDFSAVTGVYAALQCSIGICRYSNKSNPARLEAYSETAYEVGHIY